ncbi:hypothetical protein EDB85DRAFT_65040 [Lactarius pseudohatsudake]|nr:hypothetical protein EDB85DRAFT_65040 [Lactarius pseudohatsudake]
MEGLAHCLTTSLFDVDGTLIDSTPGVVAAWELFAETYPTINVRKSSRVRAINTNSILCLTANAYHHRHSLFWYRLHEVVILVVGMEMDQEYDEGNICSAFLETTPELHRCELGFESIRVAKVRSELESTPVWTLTRGNTTLLRDSP